MAGSVQFLRFCHTNLRIIQSCHMALPAFVQPDRNVCTHLRSQHPAPQRPDLQRYLRTPIAIAWSGRCSSSLSSIFRRILVAYGYFQKLIEIFLLHISIFPILQAEFLLSAVPEITIFGSLGNSPSSHKLHVHNIGKHKVHTTQVLC